MKRCPPGCSQQVNLGYRRNCHQMLIQDFGQGGAGDRCQFLTRPWWGGGNFTEWVRKSGSHCLLMLGLRCLVMILVHVPHETSEQVFLRFHDFTTSTIRQPSNQPRTHMDTAACTTRISSLRIKMKNNCQQTLWYMYPPQWMKLKGSRNPSR